MATWSAADVPPMDGETVVVTGANSGLGYEATKVLVGRGATVVMACRSVERGERAAAAVRAEIGDTSGGALDVRECDLATLDSVASFVAKLREDYDAVDVLCNNAGVMAIPRSETADGFEMQLGVNHLGHFALTGRLFDLLAASDGRARVVTHSSGAHTSGEMDFSDLNWEESYARWPAYSRSKLANLLFAYELQRRIDADGRSDVMSVACHPGYAATNLQANSAEARGSRLAKLGMWVANRVFAQSAARGALPMLYAATGDVESGDYVGPGGFLNVRGAPEVQESSAASYDEADARRLWEYSTEATGVTFPFDGEEEVAAGSQPHSSA